MKQELNLKIINIKYHINKKYKKIKILDFWNIKNLFMNSKYILQKRIIFLFSLSKEYIIREIKWNLVKK